MLTNVGSAPVEQLALKIAGFYSPELAAPEFSSSATSASAAFSLGKQGTISIMARSTARSAPDSVIELEIWDESNKAVYKSSRTDQNFLPGESRRYDFTWTPKKPGKYTLNFGIYGPEWTPSYSWHESMATIAVE